MAVEWKKIEVKEQSSTDYLMKRRCPICNHNQSKTILSYDNFQFFTDSNIPKQADVNTVQCKKCGAFFMNPCYSTQGFKVLFSEAGMSYGSTDARPYEQVDWLSSYGLLKDGNSILDIGCGTGKFLSTLPSSMHCVGVDIDSDSIEKGKKDNSNIEFICSSFDGLKYEKHIDLITMYHVLEHLPNPKETLIQLHSLSNEKTRLVVEVPIIENGLTNDINGFFSVQHLTHFSRLSLRNILCQSGWKILEWMEQSDYNGCRVLVQKSKITETKKGKEEGLNLFNYFSFWYESLKVAETKLRELSSQYVVIWGGGMHLEFIYQISSLFNNDCEFIIVDSDPLKQNKLWRGIPIYAPSVLDNVDKEVGLVISSYKGQSSIEKAALSFGFKSQNIVKLYDYVKVY